VVVNATIQIIPQTAFFSINSSTSTFNRPSFKASIPKSKNHLNSAQCLFYRTHFIFSASEPVF
jgi:hypothetical protein